MLILFFIWLYFLYTFIRLFYLNSSANHSTIYYEWRIAVLSLLKCCNFALILPFAWWMNGLRESIASELQSTVWNIYFQKTPSKLFWKKSLTYNPAIVLVNLCPRCMKTCIPMKACAWLSIIALFVIVKTWKQFRWMVKVWYLHIMKHNSAIKRCEQCHVQQLGEVSWELFWMNKN